jgi:hypothetical protein
VDCVAVATGAEEGAGGLFVRDPDVPLILGGGSRADFEGDLAAVRVWNRALDPHEVRELASRRADLAH